MNNETLAYIAGIVDGEGAVTLYRTGTNAHPMAVLSPRLVVEMTDRGLIDWLHVVTGVGTIGRYVPKNPRAKVRWRWRVGGRQAATLVGMLRPWLRVKATQADAILAFQATRTNQCKSGLSNKTIVERGRLLSIIRVANQRGLLKASRKDMP